MQHNLIIVCISEQFHLLSFINILLLNAKLLNSAKGSSLRILIKIWSNLQKITLLSLKGKTLFMLIMLSCYEKYSPPKAFLRRHGIHLAYPEYSFSSRKNFPVILLGEG